MSKPTHQRSLWQVLGLYAAASWICLQVVDVLTQNIPLPRWVFTLTLGLLVLGLPVAAVTAYLQGIGRTASSDGASSSVRRMFTWGNVLRGGVAALALWGVAVTGWLVLGRDSGSQWDALTGLDEVRRLASAQDWAPAYTLAGEVDALIDSDSVRAQLWSEVSRPLTIRTEPEGARVFRKYYGESDEGWEDMGLSPVAADRFPFGLHRLRFEMEGHVTRQIAAYSGALADASPFILDRPGALPEGMVRVSGGQVSVFAPGLEQVPPVELGDFFMAAHEVTNREYKEFVDAGGYDDPACWMHPFVVGGQTLARDDALARFTDRTGRPGPSTWEVGGYPDGTGELPVGGVSWYEAEAYACFRSLALPTVYHWYHEADPFSSNYVVPQSNFGDSGLVPVGSAGGVSQDGVFDMAGNVREWARNAVGEDRFNLGGGWNDLPYAFNDAVTSPAFDRSPSNGIRLASYPDTTGLTAASAPIVPQFRDYSAERPVSDEVFEAYRQAYAYDDTPLDPRVVSSDTTVSWIREGVEINAAYGGERMKVFLFIPRERTGPAQPVVYFPGSDDIYKTSFDELAPPDFPMRSGRVLVHPIYKGTFDRAGDLQSDIQDETTLYRDHVVAWAKDLGRSLDYALSRPEVGGSVGYLGISWGAAMAPIMLALEPRIEAAVLIVGGLAMQETQPMVDPFNFLPRVTTPTLMVNGEYDSFFPVETAQRPFFDNLGVSEPDKKLIITDSNHFVLSFAGDLAINESLDWYDRYLGPVR